MPKFGKSKIFLLFCLSFAVGVALGHYLNFWIMAVAAVIFVILISVFWRQRWPMLVGFLGLTLLLGAWRLQTSFPYDDTDFVGRLYGQKVELEGVVVKDPDVRSDKVNLTVKPLTLSEPPLNPPDTLRESKRAGLPLSPRLRSGQGEKKLVGNILLSMGKYPEYRYGDHLKIAGKLEKPFESEEFSYKDYLARYDTYAVIRFPKIEKLGSGEGSKITSALLAVKHKFQEVLSSVLPEPHNALALGLILGLKRSLPEDLKQALIVAGVSHIVVISGYNISIITRNLLKTRTWWGVRAAFWLSLLTVLAFVIITGAEASVIRAAVMGMMLVLALNLGRLYQSVNALVFVGALMVLQNPKILSFDIGFQLSFLATLGLIYLAPLFEKWLSFVPEFAFLAFRSNLASTLAALTLTIPLLIFYFDRISLVAPLANVAILWSIPYTMFFAFFTGLGGIIFLPVAQILAGLPWVLLEFQIRAVEWFASLPLASVFSQINIFAMLAYYVLVASAVMFYRHKKKFYYYLEYVPVKL